MELSARFTSTETLTLAVLKQLDAGLLMVQLIVTASGVEPLPGVKLRPVTLDCGKAIVGQLLK